QKGDRLRAILINAASINGLDSSAAHALEEIVSHYAAQGVKTYFSGVRGPVRDALAKAHLIEKIGKENFFMNVEQAVQQIEADGQLRSNGIYKNYTLQTNQ
ncbi:sodium-independent anion transporter, partial [Arthrospira platensis SPKY1]|nr:sodium-independent anion transporter [Arthrospira platensis SPKY1]